MKGMRTHLHFLKTGHSLDTLHRFGKVFSFKQSLNNFVQIGNNPGLIFLKTTTGMFSGSLTFLGSTLLISLEIVLNDKGEGIRAAFVIES